MLRFTANLSLLFTEVEIIQRFKLAKTCGFEAVEIQFPYVLPAQSIKQQLLLHDLKLVLFNVAADDLLQGGEGLAAVPEKRDLFRQAIAQTMAYAEILQPEVINVLPGRCLQTKRLGQYRHCLLENLNYAVQAFSALGIKTVFEAVNSIDMPGFIIHNHAQMLDILEQIQHPMLAMQYDIYHMVKMQQDPTPFINSYANKIGHIQFADVPGRAQPGTGQIDFTSLFEVINGSGYQGWLGAEYIPEGASCESFSWLKHEYIFEHDEPPSPLSQ